MNEKTGLVVEETNLIINDLMAKAQRAKELQEAVDQVVTSRDRALIALEQGLIWFMIVTLYFVFVSYVQCHSAKF